MQIFGFFLTFRLKCRVNFKVKHENQNRMCQCNLAKLEWILVKPDILQ